MAQDQKIRVEDLFWQSPIPETYRGPYAPPIRPGLLDPIEQKEKRVMPIGPNGERLPYPGPAMGGAPGPDMPVVPRADPATMGMGPGPDIPPQGPPMPPPDLAAGAAPGMKEAIVGRLQELEQEKAQLMAALQNMDQMEAPGMGSPGLLA